MRKLCNFVCIVYNLYGEFCFPGPVILAQVCGNVCEM
jgi:hypothetical protein